MILNRHLSSRCISKGKRIIIINYPLNLEEDSKCHLALLTIDRRTKICRLYLGVKGQSRIWPIWMQTIKILTRKTTWRVVRVWRNSGILWCKGPRRVHKIRRTTFSSLFWPNIWTLITMTYQWSSITLLSRSPRLRKFSHKRATTLQRRQKVKLRSQRIERRRRSKSRSLCSQERAPSKVYQMCNLSCPLLRRRTLSQRRRSMSFTTPIMMAPRLESSRPHTWW